MKTSLKFFKTAIRNTVLILIFHIFPFICNAQLSGTSYTIDPAGGPFPNFISFQAAVDSLASQGVNGPVVINIADGTYTERITINQITGASAVNRITIQSQSLDSSKVVLTYQNKTYQDDNWVLRLNGADYVTIRKIRVHATGSYYARAININGKADHNIIENCQLWSSLTGYDAEIIASFADQAENNTIRNNYFLLGSAGIRMEGINNSTLSSGTQIYNNLFVDQGSNAIYLRYQNAPIVDNNSFNINRGGARGIYLSGCFNEFEIRNNKINITDGSDGGVLLEYCYGTAGQKSLVKNNFITIGGYKDAARGIHINCAQHLNIFHNSVNITSTSPGANSSGFYQTDYSSTTNSSDIDIRNNIFSNSGGSYAIYISNTEVIFRSDNNDYHSTGEYLAYWGGVRRDLQALQSANGKDANSVSVNPRFFSATDLHSSTFWLDGKGTTGTGISADIDGENRLSPPDIGADEFTATILPLSAGTYKIGGTTPDYLSIKDALDDLQVKGVSGPVRFEIRNGEYNEFIGEVYEIPGASAADSIVLTSESGNPEDVVIHFSTDAANRNIFLFKNTDHFTMMKVSVTATGATTGRTVRIEGKCANLNIVDSRLSAENITDALLSVEGPTEDIVIVNNSFSKGGQGIYFYGDVNNYSSNTQIIGNSFTDPTLDGIRLRYHLSPYIAGNTIIKTSSSDYSAMELINCEKDLRVIGNTISSSMGKIGIRLNSCVATNPFNSLVANNMIQIGGSSEAYGIIVYSSKRANIYHNSVNITSSDSILGRAVYMDLSEGISILNNIFANNGTGYALYVNDPGNVSMSDYNGLFASGTNLAFWGGTNYTNLTTLSNSSGMDTHSLIADPLYVSETDLHSQQIAFEKAAIRLEDVKIDIDGHPRDLENPDIGAAEFYCETPDFNISVSATCFGDTTSFIDNSGNITTGATYGWDFDGDWSPDYYSTTPNETVPYYFDAPGSHTMKLIVSQIGGCEDYEEVNVLVGDLPVLEISTEGAYCGNDDGQAAVTVTNGDGPYTYSWSTGSTEPAIENLTLGDYSVAVSDTIGCTAVAEIVIDEAIEVEVNEIKGSKCGSEDGIAEVQVTGGLEPYSYVWSNGVTERIDSSLAPGLHYVNVIDANECSARASVVIGNDGSGPQITLDNIVDNDCFGDRNGEIKISISGGMQPYNILWSNGIRTKDIDHLPAGIYEVFIVDKDSCPTSETFIVSQPVNISIGSVIEEAGCKNNDGRAAVLVSGGTEPYFYSWSTGGTIPLAENLSAGIYTITIKDGNDCESVKPIIVNSVGGPTVNLLSLSNVTCTDSLSGSIKVSPSGGTPLYTWLWSPGGQTQTQINNLPVGKYEVEVKDKTGCTGYNLFEIKEEPPAVNPICLVTVDSASGMNQVVWERLNKTDVVYYNIYRESYQKSRYELIGMSPVNNPGIFTDSVADPTIRSWRYRLSAVDKCGNESELSDHHKTMHLTMNVGLDENVNLIWDHYEGFSFSSYIIWRYNASGGWNKIDSVPSNLTSYTDKNPPKEDLTYYIEVIHPTGCNFTGKKEGSLNATRSNRQQSKKKSSYPSFGEDLMDYGHFSVYPNPGPGIFNLSLDLKKIDHVDLQVFDLSGRVIMSRKFFSVPYKLETQIDLSGYSSGVYQIRLKTSDALIHRILIKE